MPPGQGKVKDEGDPGNVTAGNSTIRIKWYPADTNLKTKIREFVPNGTPKGTVVLFDLADSNTTTLATNVKKKKS